MDPALGKAADLDAEGWCVETTFLRASNLLTYPDHLILQQLEWHWRRLGGWIPPLTRLLTLVGRAARWPRRSGALESCALES